MRFRNTTGERRVYGLTLPHEHGHHVTVELEPGEDVDLDEDPHVEGLEPVAEQVAEPKPDPKPEPPKAPARTKPVEE